MDNQQRALQLLRLQPMPGPKLRNHGIFHHADTIMRLRRKGYVIESIPIPGKQYCIYRLIAEPEKTMDKQTKTRHVAAKIWTAPTGILSLQMLVKEKEIGG